MRKTRSLRDITFMIDLNESDVRPSYKKCHSLDAVKERKLEQKIQTKFNFLKDHRGLQNGHLHLLLGRTNKGKSALIHSLICENIVKNHKALLFLSEGEKGDVKRRINSMLSIKFKSNEERNKIMRNLIILDESDLDLTNVYDPRAWLHSLFKFVNEYSIEVLYFDNFSTCTFGDSTPEIQAQFVKNLCAITQQHDIPVFGVIHQSKSVSSDKELELEDIRANSAFMNSPSFIYALNNFNNLDKSLRILKILKSRLDGEIIGNYYELTYKAVKNEGFYSKDQRIETDSAKSIFFRNKTSNSIRKR